MDTAVYVALRLFAAGASDVVRHSGFPLFLLVLVAVFLTASASRGRVSGSPAAPKCGDPSPTPPPTPAEHADASCRHR